MSVLIILVIFEQFESTNFKGTVVDLHAELLKLVKKFLDPS